MPFGSKRAQGAPSQEGAPEEARRAAKRAERDARRARRAAARRAGRAGKGDLPDASYPGPRVLRTSRSAQDALGYDLLHENGVIRVEEGTYSRVIEFADINFQSARDEDQESIYRQWSMCFNELESGVRAKIMAICTVVDKARFVAERLLPMAEGDDAGNAIRAEFNSIIERKVADSRQNVERRLLIVLTVDRPDIASAEPALARACESMGTSLESMGVREVSVLDGDALLAIMDSITNPGDPEGLCTFDSLKCHKGERGKSAAVLGYTTKDLVAPSWIERPDPRHIAWGDQVGQALYVERWAHSIRTDMLGALIELPINQIITVNVVPWTHEEAVDTINSVATDLKSQKHSYVRSHSQEMYISDEMLPSDLADALDNVEELREDLDDQNMFSVGLSILAWAEDAERCDQAVELIRMTLSSYSFRVRPLTNLQLRGWTASMPTGRYDLPYSYTMTTNPLAALLPFSSVEILDRGGMYLGQNRRSKNFVFVDRTHAVAPNGFILGEPGRGKSVLSKEMILWTYLSDTDADIVVIDPEGEYGPITRAVGGEVIKVGLGSDTHINPFDLALDEADPGDGAIQLKTDVIISAVEMMCRHLTELQKSLVDRCVGSIYGRYLVTGRQEALPTLTSLYEELNAQPEPEAHMVATTIERYVKGQASIFNHPTNVDPEARLVTFDIRNLGDNLKSLAELFVLDHVWQRVVRNRSLGRRTWIFIDEIHLLFDNDHAIDFFISLWSRSRKYGAIPTGITQNVDTLLFSDKLCKLISNSDFLYLLGQSSTDAEIIGNERRLSDKQVEFLTTAKPGSGIVCVPGRTVEFENHIPEDTEIYRLVNTKPEAMARIDREEK